MDFVAIDFEIANPKYASVCAFGWATVRDGKIFDHGSWLCRPPAGYATFAPRNVQIHGITAAMVATQPALPERIPDILSRLCDDLPVVAHNAAFDISVLRQALQACGRSHHVATHHCTMKWSKQLLPLPTHKLPIVCSHLGIQLAAHHNAGSDALAAAKVALRLAEKVGASTISELEVAASCS